MMAGCVLVPDSSQVMHPSRPAGAAHKHTASHHPCKKRTKQQLERTMPALQKLVEEIVASLPGATTGKVGLPQFLAMMEAQRFLCAEGGRYWVALSLREAESLRGCLHVALDNDAPLVGGARSGLRRARSGPWRVSRDGESLDISHGGAADGERAGDPAPVRAQLAEL